MRLVIFHYHLNRGGVTSVIRSHLQALARVAGELEIESVTVAYGGRAADWPTGFEAALPFPVRLISVPALEYDELQQSGLELAESLDQVLAELGCDQEQTILHAHNHGLGKNSLLPAELRRLATDGWRVLLQIHDFAEDLRPGNYAHLLASYGDAQSLWEVLYPQATHIHYATLNRADMTALSEAGIAAACLHLLPNPASMDESNVTESEKRRAARTKLNEVYSVSESTPYVLYPVRGIRRKNLGEILLWSLLIEPATIAITLQPNNEVELQSYNRWKEFAESLSLRVIFGAGKELSLDENYAAADAVISTSVAEGFGLVFLEASLRSRPLFGRDLKGVTTDFVDNGVRFPGLAEELLVPNTAFDGSALRASYERYSRRLREDYACVSNDDDELKAQLDQLLMGEWIDFGRLDTTQQRLVISNVQADRAMLKRVAASNPIVDRVRDSLGVSGERAGAAASTEARSDCLDASAKNQIAIGQHYSNETIGRRLSSIYQTLLSSPVGSVRSSPDTGRDLLEYFVRPEHLRPLRIET